MSRVFSRSSGLAPLAARWAAVALLANAWTAARVDAQAAGEDFSEEAAEDAIERNVGDAADALPGYVRTRVAGERPRGFAANAGLGYGYTESLSGAPGSHHRLPFSFALSGHPWRALGVGIHYEGRGDFHQRDDLGRDRGFVGQGSFDVRAAGFVGAGLALGANASMLVFGDDDGLDLGSLSLEATGLVSYLRGGLSLALEAGYRYDRSGTTASPAAIYRAGDRLSLGVSDFDAVLLRVGLGCRRGALEGVGEVRWDLLVGDAAPDLVESPLHVAAAGRYHASAAVQLELAIDVTVSSRPSVANGDPFVVVDPRVAIRAGLDYRFGRARGRRAPVEASSTTEAPPVIDEPREPPPGPVRVLEGVVRDDTGAPVVDALVVARVGEVTIETHTNTDGHFRIDGLSLGEATVDITATQHEPLHFDLGARDLRLPERELTLRTTEARGVLRGLVRDFDGDPVRATIRIEPGGVATQTSEDGSFETDLPPGAYTVTVEARGFQTQSRTVTLSGRQVTIYNVDLREGR